MRIPNLFKRKREYIEYSKLCSQKRGGCSDNSAEGFHKPLLPSENEKSLLVGFHGKLSGQPFFSFNYTKLKKKKEENEWKKIQKELGITEIEN